MLRVTKDRKLKYVSLGISVNPVHWDFSKNEPKADCPNCEYIEMLIADKIKEYFAKIIELKATHQEFTSTSLVEKVNVKRTKRKTVEVVFQEYIASLIFEFYCEAFQAFPNLAAQSIGGGAKQFTEVFEKVL